MAEPDLSRLRIQRDAPVTTSGGRGPWLWIVIVGLVVAAGIAWATLRPKGIQVQVATASATGGGTATAAGITANGYVVARTKASVSAEVMGRLEYLGVQEGSDVKKGFRGPRCSRSEAVARARLLST